MPRIKKEGVEGVLTPKTIQILKTKNNIKIKKRGASGRDLGEHKEDERFLINSSNGHLFKRMTVLYPLLA